MPRARSLDSVEDHLARILVDACRLPSETVALDDALGRTAAEPVVARHDVPLFENSAMDGYAVRFADVAHASPRSPVALSIVGDLPAGASADPDVAWGSAVRVMTGAPLPTDADTVVPLEDTIEGFADELTIITVASRPRAVGAHVRRAGEDLRKGGEITPAGALLGPLQLSAASAAGVAEFVVTRAPRVAVISTGSELAEPGVVLRRGQIPESNSRLLAAMAAEAGGLIVCRTSVPDDVNRLRALVADVTSASSPIAADVVVFSGGVSAGAYEVVKQTLDGVMTFTSVAMQPGKPQGYGRLPNGTLLFGLPGNPVSAAVSFEVFVRPALLRLQGRADLHRPTLMLPATRGWRTAQGRRQYLPVSIDRSDPRAWRVMPATTGGSHLAGRLGSADGFAVVPPEIDTVSAGDAVTVMLLS